MHMDPGKWKVQWTRPNHNLNMIDQFRSGSRMSPHEKLKELDKGSHPKQLLLNHATIHTRSGTLQDLRSWPHISPSKRYITAQLLQKILMPFQSHLNISANIYHIQHIYYINIYHHRDYGRISVLFSLLILLRCKSTAEFDLLKHAVPPDMRRRSSAS